MTVKKSKRLRKKFRHSRAKALTVVVDILKPIHDWLKTNESAGPAAALLARKGGAARDVALGPCVEGLYHFLGSIVSHFSALLLDLKVQVRKTKNPKPTVAEKRQMKQVIELIENTLTLLSVRVETPFCELVARDITYAEICAAATKEVDIWMQKVERKKKPKTELEITAAAVSKMEKGHGELPVYSEGARLIGERVAPALKEAKDILGILQKNESLKHAAQTAAKLEGNDGARGPEAA